MPNKCKDPFKIVPPTQRQWQQRNLRQAIGTVKGFHGYLHNLKEVLKRTGEYKAYPMIDAMHEQLKSYEDHLRVTIKNIP